MWPLTVTGGEYVELRSLSRDVRLCTGVLLLIDGEKGRMGTGDFESFLVMARPLEDMTLSLCSLWLRRKRPKVESHVHYTYSCDLSVVPALGTL